MTRAHKISGRKRPNRRAETHLAEQGREIGTGKAVRPFVARDSTQVDPTRDGRAASERREDRSPLVRRRQWNVEELIETPRSQHRGVDQLGTVRGRDDKECASLRRRGRARKRSQHRRATSSARVLTSSTPSSSVKSWFTTRSDTPPPLPPSSPPPRLGHSASSSSKKTTHLRPRLKCAQQRRGARFGDTRAPGAPTHGAEARARSNSVRTARSDSPTYLSRSSGPFTDMKFAPDSRATALAISVWRESAPRVSHKPPLSRAETGSRARYLAAAWRAVQQNARRQR